MSAMLYPPLVLWRSHWLRAPEPTRYFGFPRVVVVEDVCHVKYQAGSSSGRPGTHALPPVEERVLRWDLRSGIGVKVDESFTDWVSRHRNDSRFACLLADGGALNALRDLGWVETQLGGSCLEFDSAGTLLWPVYGCRTPGGTASATLLRWTPLRSAEYEPVLELREDGRDITELGGARVDDGCWLLVGRCGEGFEEPARCWIADAALERTWRMADCPLPLHWPQLLATRSHGVVLVGRGPRGLVSLTWEGDRWSAPSEPILRPTGWWGNAGYAALFECADGELQVITYGPTLAPSPETVETAALSDDPGILAATLLASRVTLSDGKVAPFDPSMARVCAGVLTMAPGVAAVHRVPLAELGTSDEVAEALFAGLTPDRMDYHIVLE